MYLLIIASVALAIIIVGAFLLYIGLFNSPKISTGKPMFGSMYIAYNYYMGKYSECGSHFQSLGDICGWDKTCLGIFYDNPEIVPPEKCHYLVGVILSDMKEESILATKLKEKGYKFALLPQVQHVISTKFPFRSSPSFLMGLSAAIGAYKVYPRIEKYAKEYMLSAHPCMELYLDDQIYYMCPLSRSEEFYVPEAKEIYQKLTSKK